MSVGVSRWVSFACACAVFGCGPSVALTTADGSASGGDSGSTSAAGSISISGSTSVGADDTAGMATTGSACAPWGESCASMPCCDDELECTEGSMLCLEPDVDGGVTFFDGNIGGDSPPPFECSMFDHDCPRGDKCMPWANDGGNAWNATRCIPIPAKPAQVGDDCAVEGAAVSGIDNCDQDLVCWDVDPVTLMGTCTPVCGGSEANPICEDTDTTCAIANNGAIVLCLPTCNPLMQDCAVGDGCFPVGDGFVCSPDASGAVGEHGDPCAFVNACAPGNICLSPDAHSACASREGCCTSLCNVSGMDPDGDCAALDPGQTCISYYAKAQAPVGLEDVGVCTVTEDATISTELVANP